MYMKYQGNSRRLRIYKFKILTHAYTVRSPRLSDSHAQTGMKLDKTVFCVGELIKLLNSASH